MTNFQQFLLERDLKGYFIKFKQQRRRIKSENRK